MTKVTLGQAAQIQRLKEAVHLLPQQPMHTEHFFVDGMYTRQIFIPAGTIFVGGKQKKPHFFMVLKGSAQVTLDGRICTFRAGMVLPSVPGTQRAGLTLEDTVFAAVYRTDETDLEKLRNELVEEDPLAQYDGANQIKELPWSGQ